MLGRLSLTTRLAAFYTLVSAAVLVGMGVLVSQATERHFVELDRDYLHDKIELIQKIVLESPSPDILSDRLDELLGSHHGLFIDLRQGDAQVYGQPTPAFPSGLPAALAGADPVDWTEGLQTLRGFSARLNVQPSSAIATPTDWQLKIAVDTAHHAHFMQGLRLTLT